MSTWDLSRQGNRGAARRNSAEIALRRACRAKRALLFCVSSIAVCGIAGLVAASAGAAQVEGIRAHGGASSVTIAATVDPEGEETRCELQYETQAAFEAEGYAHPSAVACAPGSVTAAAAEVQLRLENLAEDTAYRFRFALTGTVSGAVYAGERQFATFGVASTSLVLQDQKGEPYSQAGGHPFALVDSISLNTVPYLTYRAPDGQPRDIVAQLPQGLVGNPMAAPQCSRLDSERHYCPAASQVGTMTVTLGEQVLGQQETFTEPLYNLVPPKGVPAQFGARISNIANGFIDASVRTGEGYGISAASLNIASVATVLGVSVTMWGVPGAATHAGERYCRTGLGAHLEKPPCAEGEEPMPEKPFLTAPTSCRGPLTTTVAADSYQHPGKFFKAAASVGEMTGCGQLQFHPTLSVAPETSSSDSPAGVEVHLHLPQNENPEELATPDLRDATVTLPAGVTINPAAADGMVACPLLTGQEPKQEEQEADGTLSGINLDTRYPANCPDESKIGKVELETPLFPHRVFEGGIYVAAQDQNPFGSLLAIYIAIDEPQTGIVVKLAGDVQAGGQSGVSGLAAGQLRTMFSENPQLPFEDLRLKFFGGPRAALATPRTCGTYTATSLLEPWSHQGATGEAGTPDAQPSSPFTIATGPAGGACPATAFAPSLVAGTEDNRAGAYSSFALILRRRDGEPRFTAMATTMPKGLAGMITHVQECGEAQANAGTCPASSQIGHVTVEAGVGHRPVTLPQAGRPQDPVYFTGPYDGAPFGLSIVVHAEAGPFNLGTVVVRARVAVYPRTGQVSIVTDTSGPHAMPTMLQGIPVDVKALDVVVDRSGFMFNPTNCKPMTIMAAVRPSEGATASASSRFQAAGCRVLKFKPTFKSLTHSYHSRQKGAYLHVTVTPKAGQANLKKVFVQLPAQLPSRESTLKRACTEAQFAESPAGCPAESKVGYATVYTPVLPGPLKGPAIFVSHGGRAYPDLDLVLHGDGITIIQVGHTKINNKKGGLTTSSFNAIPDLPVREIDVVLPEKEFSALGATGNLCYRHVTEKKRVRVRRHKKWVHVVKTVRRRKRRILRMPTILTGQNGAVVHKNVVVAVTGCTRPGKASSVARHR